MSDYIPFEMQMEIIKRLPVKSLLQSRSVSKAWKSLIDSSHFLKHYRAQQQQLLVRYDDTVDSKVIYVLIADDDTFPQQKAFVTIPPRLVNMNNSNNTSIIGCSHGLLCLFDDFQEGRDGHVSGTGTAVIWNPAIRKGVVAVVLPSVVLGNEICETVLGFGVCSETIEPKIVKVTYVENWRKKGSIPWLVEVFTLSTRGWRFLCSSNLPRKSIQFDYYGQGVALDGVFYWLATDRIIVDDEIRASSNLLISFDMTSDEFREVNLPQRLAHQPIDNLTIYELRGSLVVLEHDIEANNAIVSLWMMEDGDPKSFTKLFTANMPDTSEVNVTGFRKTGELIINSTPDPESTGSLDVYEPYSKSISSLGINGIDFSYYVYSYIETLLLLDQPRYTVSEMGN